MTATLSTAPADDGFRVPGEWERHDGRWMLAERGLQVVIQSVRGTFGSSGTFNPFDERADGLATLRWLRRQPWHAGPIGMTGESYLGLTQWAVAADAGDDLAALSIHAPRASCG